ncbi:MAG: alpha-1,2-fucosyltransferase [Opitutaceae bacterium]|nr:alpha-1,2-fucosyltransferase [Opitutaceae bacterium]
MRSSRKAEVCVKLSGRLGNQMFQYATGLALAWQLGASLTLDGPPADAAPKERIRIVGSFGLSEHCYHSGTSLAENLARLLARTCGVLRPPLWKRGLPIVHETGLTFDDRIFAADSGCHLMGRWQSPRYFGNIEAELRRVFALGRWSGPAVQADEIRIRGEPRPVAVHVRRGDYATNARTRRRFGLCRRPYYDAARRYLENTVRPSHYFVFSDDPQAARSELAGWRNTTFIAGHGAEEDLWLMHQCRQAIISNSTFAWWGGWLIPPAADKTIVAPRQWFSEAMQRRKPTHDLYADGWVRL